MRWGGVLAGLVLVAGLFFADSRGLGGLYELSTIFLGGTGFAIALFWGSRRATWFWPTVVLLVAAHIVALCSVKWGVLVPGGGQAVKGGVGLDFAVNALTLYIVRGLFDPEAVAKTQPEAVAKVIKLGFAVLCLAIPVVLTLVVIQAHQKKLAALRTVFFQDSPFSEISLMDCLEPINGKRDQGWEDAKGSYPAKELFEWDLDKRIRIVDRQTMRQVEVDTLQGRPLYPEESRLLSRCLMP